MASCDGRLTLIPVTNDPENENWIGTMRSIVLVGALVAALATSGCAGMTDTEQRAGTGAAIGAAGGAVIGALSGNTLAGAVIGTAAGTLGGLLVDKSAKDKEKAKEKAYQEGYDAGKKTE